MKVLSVILLILALGLLGITSSNTWMATAEARPGGGHSSHHSSSRSHTTKSSSWGKGSIWRSSSSGRSNGHSSSFSRSGGSAKVSGFWVLVIFLCLLMIMLVLYHQAQSKTVTSRISPTIKKMRAIALDKAFASLQNNDPNFSKVLLLDFVHLLFNKLYQYRGSREFAYLTPFISDEVRQHFLAEPNPAKEVVINGIHWEDVVQTEEQDRMTLSIDANYTLLQNGRRNRYAISERWLLCRKAGIISAKPEKMQALTCTYCAAPAHFNDAGACPYCRNVLHKGEMQWFLQKRVVLQTTLLDQSGLVAYAHEQGTKLPTVMQPDLTQQIENMQYLHDISDWHIYFSDFQKKVVEPYFLVIYHHWSHGTWEGVRHLLSDRLFESNCFWMDFYRQHHWYNRLNDLRVDSVVLTKLEVDRYYESITVRIFASCYDFVETVHGSLVAGSKKQVRHYSEYWTFVRRIGAEYIAKPTDLYHCPQCGAAADKMGQAATCGYCGSKISTGEFSWVLFLIMQDDVYRG